MSVLPLRQRLVIEAFDCTGLNDIDRAYDFLVAVADTIEVTLYSQPIIMKTPGQGLTGVAILLESAEILHQWPEYAFMDFYLESCKAFNVRRVLSAIKEWFKPDEIKEVVNHILI